MNLYEATRNDLIKKSKSSIKGKERFNRRNKSRIQNTVKAMNSIDMNRLFKEDILTINLPVQGETDNYTVTITFTGLLDLLRDELKHSNKDSVTFREISRACINGFNKGDVYISCNCPDSRYRFKYWNTRNDVNSTAPETRPSDITNPDDTLGSTCKHVLLVLNNTSWILRVGRVIMNYIDYMKKHYQKLYADVIYPAIFDKEYEEPVQLTLSDTDELISDKDVISKANIEKQQSTRFKPGNVQGIRYASNSNNQQNLPIENPDDTL